MKKTLTYSSFALSLVVVIFMFATAKDYTQLGAAVLIYPVFAYVVLSLFPRKGEDHEITVKLPIPQNAVTDSVDATTEPSPKVEVADIDKRAFLKLIGVAGISYFIFSIFSKKAQLPFFGKLGGGTDSVTIKDTEGVAINPAERQPLDGYQISEIEDSVIAYYGFINNKGEWYIMKEDTEKSSFRYAKGNESFPQGWANRSKLKYDYFHNL